MLKWKKPGFGHQETHCGRFMVSHNVNGGDINSRWFAYMADEGIPGVFDEPMTFDGFPKRAAAKRYCEIEATPQLIANVQSAALSCYGLSLSPDQARRVLNVDPDLMPELEDGPELDTLPREDLGDAILAVVLPGPPTVQDSLIGFRQDRWHWPLNGSEARYRREFLRALRAAIGRGR